MDDAVRVGIRFGLAGRDGCWPVEVAGTDERNTGDCFHTRAKGQGGAPVGRPDAAVAGP